MAEGSDYIDNLLCKNDHSSSIHSYTVRHKTKLSGDCPATLRKISQH